MTVWTRISCVHAGFIHFVNNSVSNDLNKILFPLPVSHTHIYRSGKLCVSQWVEGLRTRRLVHRRSTFYSLIPPSSKWKLSRNNYIELNIYIILFFFIKEAYSNEFSASDINVCMWINTYNCLKKDIELQDNEWNIADHVSSLSVVWGRRRAEDREKERPSRAQQRDLFSLAALTSRIKLLVVYVPVTNLFI